MRRRTRALVAGLIATAALTGTGTAYAWWHDNATATSGTFGSHLVTSQASPGCTNVGGVLGLLGSVELTWLHVDPRYEYQWQVIRSGDGSVRGSGVLTPTGGTGSQVVLPIAMSLLNVSAEYNMNVVVRARLRAAPSWTAATATSTPIHSVSILFIGLSLRCGTA